MVYSRPQHVVPVQAPNDSAANTLGSQQTHAHVSSHQQPQQQPSTIHAPLDDDNVAINIMPLIAAITTVSGGVEGLGVEGVLPVGGDEGNAARQARAQAPLGQGQV